MGIRCIFIVHKPYMKHKAILLFFLSLLTASFSPASQWNPVHSTRPAKSSAEVISSDIRVSRIRFNLEGYFLDQVSTPQGNAVVVRSPGGAPMLEKGMPDVPQFAVSVIIPDAGTPEVVMISGNYREISGVDIAPSKGNLYRTVDPASVPFVQGPAYETDAFWPVTSTALRSPYILRDLRGVAVLLKPFQYNPVTRTLRIYSDMIVEVRTQSAVKGTNELNRTHSLQSADPAFLSVYKNHFANFPALTYVPVPETPKLLVICPDQWMPLMQPFVDWKIRKGIQTEMVDVLSAGGTANAIQAFIANQYQTNGIGYVLLVGDNAQLPTLTVNGGASDPSFGFIVGNDSYAEVMVGRFSAESSADVETQVQRVINYELYADTSQHHFSKGVVVGSNQGPGDDNEMDWEHEQNIRTDYLNFTYTDVAELYDGTHPGTTDLPGDPSHTDLFNLFQSGLGIMSYTGHGSNQACSTTGLSNNDVALMTNSGMLPFIWAVACVNGEFTMAGGPCFAEKFLRAQVNGQPTGAIATFMSSINQSWDPPMDAQDEMVDLLIQSVPSNAKYTFGGMSVNGCLHMNDVYGMAGDEMTNTWHCFGDPTLNVRTATPQLMSISHAATIPVGVGSLQVSGNFDGATVALSMNGSILGTGTISGGIANLSFIPVSVPDTIFVTVTGFNQVTYTGTVLVIPASGPYVIYQAGVCNDPAGNNNGLVDFNEQIDVDLTVQNVGLADAQNVTATLSTADPYITITSAVASLGNVATGASFSLSNAFQFTVASNVPDQHVVQFIVTATDQSGNSWNSSFAQTIQAPALAGGILSVDDAAGGDGDGQLEAGETANITIRCLNNGHSDAPLSQAGISTLSSYLTLITNSVTVGTIGSQQYQDAVFQVSLASNVAVGTVWDLTLSLGSGAYQASKLYTGVAGLILEDFETGNFSKFNWLSGGTGAWFTTTAAPFEGMYCAQSGPIADLENVDLELTINALADDSLTFWYKVSSEQDYDFLNYYVDGVKIQGWSGNIAAWTYAGTLLSAGAHTIRFSYEKDMSYASGSDCAWLDNIRFPYGTQTTGIAVVTGTDGLSVWPNPSAGPLNIRWNAALSGPVIWNLFTPDGRLVDQGQMTFQSNMQIQSNAGADGLYILKLMCGDALRTVKVRMGR